MARGNPNWGKPEPIAWKFRVRGKNPQGQMVTLGNHESEAEAKARFKDLTNEGYYSNLKILPVKPKPPAADEEE